MIASQRVSWCVEIVEIDAENNLNGSFKERKKLIYAVFSTAENFRLLEIEGEEESDVHALAADAAADRVLEEEKACEITGAET